MISGMKLSIRCILVIKRMNPSAETCVGIIMIARMNVKIAFLPLKSYEWIA